MLYKADLFVWLINTSNVCVAFRRQLGVLESFTFWSSSTKVLVT